MLEVGGKINNKKEFELTEISIIFPSGSFLSKEQVKKLKKSMSVTKNPEPSEKVIYKIPSEHILLSAGSVAAKGFYETLDEIDEVLGAK